MQPNALLRFYLEGISSFVAADGIFLYTSKTCGCDASESYGIGRGSHHLYSLCWVGEGELDSGFE